jgi:hypothetical protein
MNPEPSPDPPSSFRRLVGVVGIVLLLGLLIGAGVVLVRMQAAARSRWVTLTDGTRVGFLDAKIGGAAFTSEQPWEKIARKYLPYRLQGWMPAVVNGSCSSGSNSLTVYVRISRPLATGGPPPWNGYVAEDSTGFRYTQQGVYGTLGGASPSGKMAYVYGLGLIGFPRRQPEFPLHFLDASGVVMGTLTVPNPLPHSFAEWRPQPLPQTLSNDPVTLSLRSLEKRGIPNQPHVYPSWKLESSDPAWARARVRYYSCFDATGNEGGILSPNEPAWKLRAIVYRGRPVDFSASERFTLTNLTLPSANQFTPIDQGSDRIGVNVKVLVLAGTGELVISNGVSRHMRPAGYASVGYSTESTGAFNNHAGWTNETWGGRTPFFLVQVQNARPDDEIEFYLRDDHGRDVKITANGYQTPSNGIRMYQPEFTPPDDARFVSLEAIVNRPLVFEFFVNPADVRAPTP